MFTGSLTLCQLGRLAVAGLSLKVSKTQAGVYDLADTSSIAALSRSLACFVQRMSTPTVIPTILLN